MDTLQEYALLKARIKDCEDRLKTLEPDIIGKLKERSDMEDKNLKKEYGTFYLLNKKKYTYSEAVSEEQGLLDIQIEKVKSLKQYEEEKGIAQVVSSESSLVFKSAKMVMPKGVYQWPDLDEAKVS